MKRKIMILGASILQVPAIKTAIDMDLTVIAVDMNPNAIGFSIPGVIKEVISTIDTEAILKAARTHRIDGIMTIATDMPMRSVAIVAKELNLIGIDPQTALKATDKAEMRKALREGNVPIPEFYIVSNETEYLEVSKNFNKPFMVKPADGSGSRGIVKINKNSDFDSLLTAYHYAKEYTRNGKVIVEEHMSGSEVSVETLSIDGECNVVQITDKLTTGEPHYVEMGHSQPTGLNSEIRQQIENVTKAACNAIGIESGPSHTEIIVTEEGPKIVEIGARLGGDNITTHLVPLSTGVNMVECCIRLALGEVPCIKRTVERGAAIRYFAQHQGMVERIDGIEKAEKVNGVEKIQIVHGIGEYITDVNNSGSRMGFVIACGDNAADAISVCEKAISEINICIV